MSYRHNLFITALLSCTSLAPAHAGISATTGLMGLSNSTTQGGQGAEGSTFLTQSELTYHGSWWGAGMFFQYDKQGKSQIDTGLGPRLELTWNPFYMEYLYAMKMNRSFTDRAIAEQEGSGWTLGLGARFAIGAAKAAADGGIVQGWFLQFSYKLRTQTIKTQDGKSLDEAIVQKDNYPLFSIGLGF